MRVLFAALTIFSSVVASAATDWRSHQFGLGVQIVQPTGFSANYFLDSSGKNSIDAVVSWDNSSDRKDFYFHSTFLIHMNRFHLEKVPLQPYFGAGFRLDNTDHLKNATTQDRERRNELGIRGSGGLRTLLDAAPVEFFAELGLALNLTPSTELEANAGLGLRYYF